MLPLVLAVALSVTPSASPPPRPVQALRWHPVADAVSTGALFATWLTSELLKPVIASRQCRWCEVNGFDLAVRRAFNPALAPSASGVRPISLTSDLVGPLLTPLALLALNAGLSRSQTGSFEAWAVDALLIAQASLTALLFTQATKYFVARARPFTVGGTPELIAMGSDPSDAMLSFFSGHTNFTFAVATSAATIMSLRGYKHAWVAWLVGLPLATTTALLRIAADKHWASDVLVGAVVGAGVGALVPWLLHRPIGAEVQVSLGPDGLSLFGAW